MVRRSKARPGILGVIANGLSGSDTAGRAACGLHPGDWCDGSVWEWVRLLGGNPRVVTAEAEVVGLRSLVADGRQKAARGRLTLRADSPLGPVAELHGGLRRKLGGYYIRRPAEQ